MTASRGRKVLGILAKVALVLAVLALATWWQARGLLSSGEPSPRLSLPGIDDGAAVEIGAAAGKPVVLYFFAPWCGVCESTSSNIAGLRADRSEDELGIYAIGLDYDDPAEIRRFAREHGLTVPVLLGDDETRRAFRVGSYPTIYILDGDGSIAHRLVGYTTSLGLRLRLLFG
ncbi:MAG TPA: TlpA disulfide reductase family protein [Polyangia bacterium]|nr:TlpA disulfide reductase family protein [Polyangia bacterium]